MMRFALSTIAAALVSLVAAVPTHAQQSMGGGGSFHGPMMGGFQGHMNGGFHGRPGRHFVPHNQFAHNHFFFHHHFFVHHRFFFHPFFFFGRPVFAPVPVALIPPTPFPAFITAPAVAGVGGISATDASSGSCYQFQTSMDVNGEVQPAWGNACLQADGSWLVLG